MEILFTGIFAFASTNIDDLFILTLFFGDKQYKPIDIYFGQYLGIIVLMGVSVTGSVIGNFIDDKYIGLLGLFPIYLGIRQIIQLVKGVHEDEKVTQKGETASKTGILSVATVTIANGGDNIGTYVPLFTPLSTLDKSIMIAVFLVLVLIWLTTARYLTTHPLMVRTISRYGNIITPIVLCLLGIFILNENGSFSLLK